MSASVTDLFHFGTVIGTHGIRGDLKVRPLTNGSTALVGATEVYLRRAGSADVRQVPIRTAPHKGNVLLRLEGYGNVNLVTGFVGCEVMMLQSEMPELEEGRNSWQDIQGIAVHDRRCGDLGRVEDRFATAAHEIYVVQGPYGEVLIPVVDQFICEIDIAGNRMTVDLPEGLVPESDEN